MTYRELLKNCTDRLRDAGIEDAASDAAILMCEAAGLDRGHLLLYMTDQVAEDISERLNLFMAARIKRIPLQQIVGYTEFMGLKFYVNSDVLCPRQDTEVLVEAVIEAIFDKSDVRVLDLCTGSGCIAVSIAKLTGASVTATDISEKALAVAEKNAVSNGVSVRFLCGDLFAALPEGEKFDCIVSNPPYIRSCVIEELEPEVKDYEPRIALDGSEDGLAFYRQIAVEARSYLSENGRIFLECGYDQAEKVSDLLRSNAYEKISVIRDYGGNDRVVAAVLKSTGGQSS